ncbi:MAG: type II toxin-antitoxin system VapC family toxin [Acidimicrobiia bacterium]|nr:type II toxin-antitoxin system VapC family toxin [Acidimicrobiia bacterium]
MSADEVWYLDSSAIVKLVASEPDTPALSGFLEGRQPLISSALATAEVHRAVIPLGERFHRQAAEVLARIELVRISSEVLADAGRLEPASLRSLDAIHLATASLLGDSLGGLVTYDGRISEAAESLGWNVIAPA